MQKVLPSPLYPVVCCFLYPAKAVGKTFSNIPYLHSKTNVKLCPRSLFEPQSLGTDSRQAFLTCKEWQQPFGMNLWHSMSCRVLGLVTLLSDWLEKSCFIHLTKLSVLAGTKQVGLTASSTCSHISTCSKADSVGRREKQQFPFSALLITAENMVGNGIP